MEPNKVSKADYARLKGLNRSTVTRWAEAGKVVLDDEGFVLVAESEARLAETADPTKVGVVLRHEVEREQAVLPLSAPADGKLPETKSSQKAANHEGYNKRIKESARREEALADMAELDRDKQLGLLVDRAGVEQAMVDFSTTIRQQFETLPGDLKFRLAAETDADKIKQLLAEAIHDRWEKIAEVMKTLPDVPATARQ